MIKFPNSPIAFAADRFDYARNPSAAATEGRGRRGRRSGLPLYMLPGPARSSVSFRVGDPYPPSEVNQASSSSSTATSIGLRMT